MVNNSPFMKIFVLLFLALIATISCNQEGDLTFSESNFKMDENAIIEINIPYAEGNNSVSESINSAIENFIVNTINISEDSLNNVSLIDAIKTFDSIYIEFKDDFEESSFVWEAQIEGEVTYQSPEIICVAINTYLNTGGAHGNLNISFLNFNSQTGELLLTDDIIKISKEFIEIAKNYFKIEMKASSEERNIEDYFFGEEFHLPASIGFSDEGIILLYNVYEIASYSQGITEFTIPYEEVLQYLIMN